MLSFNNLLVVKAPSRFYLDEALSGETVQLVQLQWPLTLTVALSPAFTAEQGRPSDWLDLSLIRLK